jgi:hypothetical protein
MYDAADHPTHDLELLNCYRPDIPVQSCNMMHIAHSPPSHDTYANIPSLAHRPNHLVERDMSIDRISSSCQEGRKVAVPLETMM